MKVYYVLTDGAYDGEPYADVEIITTDRKKAEAVLAQLAQVVDRDHFDKFEEELTDYIDYYSEGWYNQWHYHAVIQEKELM